MGIIPKISGYKWGIGILCGQAVRIKLIWRQLGETLCRKKNTTMTPTPVMTTMTMPTTVVTTITPAHDHHGHDDHPAELSEVPAAGAWPLR